MLALILSLDYSRKSSIAPYSTSSGSTIAAAVCTELGKPLQVQQIPREQTVPEGNVSTTGTMSIVIINELLKRILKPVQGLIKVFFDSELWYCFFVCVCTQFYSNGHVVKRVT